MNYQRESFTWKKIGSLKQKSSYSEHLKTEEKEAERKVGGRGGKKRNEIMKKRIEREEESGEKMKVRQREHRKSVRIEREERGRRSE